MAKRKLTDAFVRAVDRAGKYGDDHGLMLRVRATGSKSWIWRGTVGGRRVDLGLGGYPYTTLREARERAFEYRKASRAGLDPRVRNRRCPTFAEAVEKVIAMHRPSWRPGGESEIDWRRTLATYAVPRLGQMRVDRITSADVMAVLQPIWNEKAVTAGRVRQRIGAVMRWAIAQGYRADNPAGDAITAALPRNGRQSRHFKALPHGEVADGAGDGAGVVLHRRCAAFAGVPRVDGGPVRRGPRRPLGGDRRQGRRLDGAGFSHEDRPGASRSAVAPSTGSARGGAGGDRSRGDPIFRSRPTRRRPLATGVWRALVAATGNRRDRARIPQFVPGLVRGNRSVARGGRGVSRSRDPQPGGGGVRPVRPAGTSPRSHGGVGRVLRGGARPSPDCGRRRLPARPWPSLGGSVLAPGLPAGIISDGSDPRPPCPEMTPVNEEKAGRAAAGGDLGGSLPSRPGRLRAARVAAPQRR